MSEVIAQGTVEVVRVRDGQVVAKGTIEIVRSSPVERLWYWLRGRWRRSV